MIGSCKGLSPLWQNHCNINTLRPKQNARRVPDDIFKCIFLNENVWISIKISLNMLKFVPKGPINNIPALIQIMAWHRPGDKPLSKPMMVSLLMHICVTWPQWVKNVSIQGSTSPTFFTSIEKKIYLILFEKCRLQNVDNFLKASLS